jgi:hypothetical protein
MAQPTMFYRDFYTNRTKQIEHKKVKLLRVKIHPVFPNQYSEKRL